MSGSIATQMETVSPLILQIKGLEGNSERNLRIDSFLRLLQQK